MPSIRLTAQDICDFADEIRAEGLDRDLPVTVDIVTENDDGYPYFIKEEVTILPMLAYDAEVISLGIMEMQTPTIDLVKEFHETYDCPVRDTPSIDVPETELRYELIREEIEELRTALDNNDTVETFDALLDILWVTYGAILTFGMPFNAGINEVARSNRSKLGLDGKPIYRESDNKVLKGPNFSPPNLRKIIEDATHKNPESR